MTRIWRFVAAGVALLLATWLDRGFAGPADVVLREVGQSRIPFDTSLKRPPIWSGGALVVVDHNDTDRPVIAAFGRDGSTLSRTPIVMPDTSRVRIRAFKRSPDGRLAFVGTAIATDGRSAAYLAVMSSGAQRLQVTRLSPFYPEDVAIAPDETIWVAGVDSEGDRGILRRFSPAGGQLDVWLPSPEFPARRFGESAEDSVLVTERDRIGWYSTVAAEYVELGLDGRLLARVPGVPIEERIDPREEPASRVDGIGMCDDASVFISVSWVTASRRGSELFTLDRAKGTWKAVGEVNGYRPVYGCEGMEVVTRAPGPPVTLRWLRVSGQP